jgi:hypothetical protein
MSFYANIGIFLHKNTPSVQKIRNFLQKDKIITPVSLLSSKKIVLEM